MTMSPSRSLDPVWATLAMHPSYKEVFEAVHDHITKSGPLMQHERLYVAMMVRQSNPCRSCIFSKI